MTNDECRNVGMVNELLWLLLFICYSGIRHLDISSQSSIEVVEVSRLLF
jgi:hypothetical protein